MKAAENWGGGYYPQRHTQQPHAIRLGLSGVEGEAADQNFDHMDDHQWQQNGSASKIGETNSSNRHEFEKVLILRCVLGH